MSISFNALAAAAISSPAGGAGTNVKVPPKRQTTATADPALVPEPR